MENGLTWARPTLCSASDLGSDVGVGRIAGALVVGPHAIIVARIGRPRGVLVDPAVGAHRADFHERLGIGRAFDLEARLVVGMSGPTQVDHAARHARRNESGRGGKAGRVRKLERMDRNCRPGGAERAARDIEIVYAARDAADGPAARDELVPAACTLRHNVANDRTRGRVQTKLDVISCVLTSSVCRIGDADPVERRAEIDVGVLDPVMTVKPKVPPVRAGGVACGAVRPGCDVRRGARLAAAGDVGIP